MSPSPRRAWIEIRKKDFNCKADALDYAYRIANGGKALHITIENIETCEVLLELYPEI